VGQPRSDVTASGCLPPARIKMDVEKSVLTFKLWDSSSWIPVSVASAKRRSGPNHGPHRSQVVTSRSRPR
jgi:hypothetical protein